jgi:hypothetical protein
MLSSVDGFRGSFHGDWAPGVGRRHHQRSGGWNDVVRSGGRLITDRAATCVCLLSDRVHSTHCSGVSGHLLQVAEDVQVPPGWCTSAS